MFFLVFLVVHAFFLVLYILYYFFNKIRFPSWSVSSDSNSEKVPYVLFSDNHVNYFKFLYGYQVIRRIMAQENDPRLRKYRSSDIDLEAQLARSSSTPSKSSAYEDLSAPKTSAKKGKATINYKEKVDAKEKCSSNNQKTTQDLDADKKNLVLNTRNQVKYDEITGTPEPKLVVPTRKSKGKFGPNTKPKGGVKHKPEFQNIETTVASKPDVEPQRQESGELTTPTLPKNYTRLHRQSTTSVEPLTSTTESGVITTEAETHFLSESSDRKHTRKTFISSQTSVKSLSDDGVDLPLHYSRINKKEPHYKGANVINQRIGSDLSSSVPIISREVKQNPRKKEKHPTVHWSNHVEFRRHKSVPDDTTESPPSPAPASPIRRREYSFQEENLSLLGQSEVYVQKRTEWSYENWKQSSIHKQNRASYAPRLHVNQQPDDSKAKNYQLNDQTRLPSFTYKQSFYGAASADKPYHSYIAPKYLQPELTTPEDSEVNFSQSESFARNIFEQYYSDDWRNLPSTSTGIMNPLEDDERKIIIEFCHLLEKSKQLFNGLRELPQYGHKQWSLYFGRTFDIYTKIWKFQQTHRAVLDSKYGMKRWQIGEIASKIGQLYYHFYLRTSETAYLNEAFSFYYAIRGRCYYTKANKEDKCELMVKKLRYYARFIVVCLLLNKMKLVKELIKELERQIIEYGNTYDPDDQVEWTVVVDEIKAFIHAEPVVSVVNTDNQTMILSHRLSPLMIPPVERSSQMNLSLQEILIVGSNSQQVKFSELTMDMFRMLQTLEREPSGDIQHIFDESPRQRFMSTPNAQSQEGVEPGQKMPNPHKYLLFKPSPGQMLVYLSSAINDLPPNGALLLYISADGYVSQNGKHADDGTWGYDLGGLITTSKNDIYRECSKDPKSSTSSKYKELQCFYPGDLYPYTRRPLFLIVDSDNSYAFQNIPRHFSQPLVILMSPLDLPPSYHDPRRQGSLFTLFLHSPLEGLCYCCDQSSVTLALWDRAQMLLDTFTTEASSIFVRSRIDPTYISFMGDDFFRVLLTRFVFCEAVLRLHRLFRGRTHHTRCSPVLPDELFEHPTLVHIIVDIANVLQIRNHIQDPSTSAAPGTGPN